MYMVAQKSHDEPGGHGGASNPYCTVTSPAEGSLASSVISVSVGIMSRPDMLEIAQDYLLE